MSYCYYILITCVFLIASSKADLNSVSEQDYNEMPLLFHVDDYDRCMALKQKTLYCSITVQLSPLQTNYSKIWNTIEIVSKNAKNYRHDKLRHRICVPEFCPSLSKNISILKHDEMLLKREISECYNNKYKSLELKGLVTEIRCETDQPLYNVDTLDIFVAVVFGVILLITVIGTVYEGTARYKSKEEYDAIINSTFGCIILI